jgi:NAD(P)-dependent dehydrogenase (short-subunit alcohol dehydrogenase family)
MAKQVRSLAGKVIVITGGGRGIGAATAAAVAAQGARVAIGDLDQHLAERTAKELGGDAIGLHLDVTDFAGFDAFLDEVERTLGPIDVLVNNAGIMPLAMLDEESDEMAAKQLAINLAAVIHGTREAMRRMKPRGSGHIVNIASVAGKFGAAGGATYSATKHGVVGLCEAVRYELRGTGVEITCVMPTLVRTELTAGLGESWLSSKVDAQDVANAIFGALQRPRHDVWVPTRLGPMHNMTRLFPRGFGEWLMRRTGSDDLLSAGAHSPERAEYERRAASSAPGAP